PRARVALGYRNAHRRRGARRIVRGPARRGGGGESDVARTEGGAVAIMGSTDPQEDTPETAGRAASDDAGDTAPADAASTEPVGAASAEPADTASTEPADAASTEPADTASTDPA